ncbi:phage antirepressor N-terminal domain-containing protein [Ancylobacter dichloromethanicus]|uniref:phage antirepressor N-terminal domain-containing protein n=1 Tax=Ancylobacter dichloromethanicus TaxID=518825 RepID=UPI00360AAB5B
MGDGIDGVIYVVIKPICDRLGIDWRNQLQRIKRDAVLSEGVVIITTPTLGGMQEMNALRLDLVNGWLFGIDEGRVKDEETRNRILMYRRECYRVLFEHFFGATAATRHPHDGGTLPAPHDAFLRGEPWAVSWMNSAVQVSSRIERMSGRAAAADYLRACGVPFLDRAPSVPRRSIDPSLDGNACLRRLLDAACRGSDLTVRGGLLDLFDGALAEHHDEIHQVLAASGVKTYRLEEEIGVAIANRHPFLSNIFRETPWAFDHARALMRLPGARRIGPLSFLRHSSRATFLSVGVIEDAPSEVPFLATA